MSFIDAIIAVVAVTNRWLMKKEKKNFKELFA
jgi:hypothetical protein